MLMHSVTVEVEKIATARATADCACGAARAPDAACAHPSSFAVVVAGALVRAEQLRSEFAAAEAARLKAEAEAAAAAEAARAAKEAEEKAKAAAAAAAGDPPAE